MKKLLILFLVFLLLVFSSACSSTTQLNDKEYGANYYGNSTLTISEKEKIAEKQALKKILEYMNLYSREFSKYHIDATEYTIGSITNSGDTYTVSGTLYLYDKYGSLEDIATFSSTVRVEDDGYYHANYPTIKIK